MSTSLPHVLCDSYKSQGLILIFWWWLLSHQEFGGREVIIKVNFLIWPLPQIVHKGDLPKFFYFLLLSTQGGPASQWHTSFFLLHKCFKHSIILDISNISSEGFFKLWKCITFSTSRKCIHVKRFMITVMKPCSFLNDFDSILQEHVHFHSSTTHQRQSTLHTTNFSYAVLKPFSKIYFCF